MNVLVKSIAYGVMWNLESVVPLFEFSEMQMAPALIIAENVSWWFRTFIMLSAAKYVSDKDNGPLFSITRTTNPDGTQRYFSFGGGDTRSPRAKEEEPVPEVEGEDDVEEENDGDLD
jgi:hypothetical protein